MIEQRKSSLDDSEYEDLKTQITRLPDKDIYELIYRLEDLRTLALNELFSRI